MISDEHIIGGCVKGKRKAFNMLYRKYAPIMLAICMRYSSGRADAEDILQEGFIKVFSHIGNYRHEGSFEGWIKRIMINTAIDHYQQRLKKGFQYQIDEMDEHELLNDQADHDPELPQYLQVEKQSLMDLMQKLPDGYRLVFNLYAIEGHSHKEIAETLGISENTSKTQLMKARRSLRKMLIEYLNKKEHSNQKR